MDKIRNIFFISLILSVVFISNLKGFSVRGEIHKYGFYSLGDNISTIYYNPAGLYNLSSKYDEFVITTEKEFTYNSFYIGKYFSRFSLFSRKYYTSLNFGFGLNNVNGKEYIAGIGGTLIDFVKYGINIKYEKFSDTKYLDYDTGIMLKFKFYPSLRWNRDEIALSFTAKNLKNKINKPLFYVTSLYVRPINELKLTSGISLDNNFDLNDYSVAFDLNIIGNFSILAGYQKYNIPAGISWALTDILHLEVLTLMINYNKEDKKFDSVKLSYRHRFKGFKIITRKGVRKKRKVSSGLEENEEDMESSVSPEIIRQQKALLEKAKFYFAQEKLKLSERKFKEVLRLSKDTEQAAEAKEWLEKIKNIKRKLRLK